MGRWVRLSTWIAIIAGCSYLTSRLAEFESADDAHLARLADIVQILSLPIAVLSLLATVLLPLPHLTSPSRRKAGAGPAPFMTARPPFGLVDGAVRGRERVIRQLLAVGRKPDGKTHVLAAMGGMGKTTVALEVCRRAEATKYRVWWVTAVDPLEISSDMLEIARQLGAAQRDIDDARAGRRSAADLVWSRLEHVSRWILVFDNADDPSVLAREGHSIAEGTGWARPSRSGLVLVTSRRSDTAVWGTGAFEIERLSVLTDTEGGQVLLDLAPRGGTPDVAASLSRRLGGLPLALHIAGAFINDELSNVSEFSSYQAELDRRFSALMSPLPPASGNSEADRRRAVATTWQISLDDLARRAMEDANDLLRLMSYFAPATSIPISLLTTSAPDSTRMTTLLQGLRSVGLVDTRSTDSGDSAGVALHPLVAETTFLSMSHEQRQERGRAAAGALTTVGRQLAAQRPEHWPMWRVISAHLSAILARQIFDPPTITLLATTAANAVWALCESGDYQAADELAQEAISAAQELGAEHPVVLTLRHTHAGVFRELGMAEDAESEYRAVLGIRRRVLGEHDSATVESLCGLSGALWDLDRLEESERGYRQVLLSPQSDQPSTIHTRYSLAGVLASSGQFAEAQQEYELASSLGERALGASHPLVLATLHQLAGVLQSRRLLAEAELTCCEALERRTAAFGPDHVSTIVSLQRLGHILEDQDRVVDAEAIYRDALARCLRTVGVRHPLTREVEAKVDQLSQRLSGA